MVLLTLLLVENELIERAGAPDFLRKPITPVESLRECPPPSA